jgi:NDP-sugar pyrophosphorylase family protein
VTSSLDAVVMAAGEGRRLRPLTERWPKPLLPVDGRPVLAVLLHELATAGFPRTTIVIGHLGEQIEQFVGDGSAYGLEVRYARQPAADGSADAVRRAVEAGAKPPLLAIAADTIFRSGDLAVANSFSDGEAAGALGVRPSNDPEKTPVRVEDGRVVALGEGDGLAGAPLWILGEELIEVLAGLSGPPYELSDAFQGALAAGKTIRALALGPTRDLTRPGDVVKENFPYLWT